MENKGETNSFNSPISDKSLTTDLNLKQNIQQVKPKSKKRRKQKISYDKFSNLARTYDYLPNDSPLEYTKLTPQIRDFIVEKLKIRPYEEQELYRALNRFNPSLACALDYLFEHTNSGWDDSVDKFKEAFDIITKGIEIRFKGNKSYWGLTSKLDSA